MTAWIKSALQLNRERKRERDLPFPGLPVPQFLYIYTLLSGRINNTWTYALAKWNFLLIIVRQLLMAIIKYISSSIAKPALCLSVPFSLFFFKLPSCFYFLNKLFWSFFICWQVVVLNPLEHASGRITSSESEVVLLQKCPEMLCLLHLYYNNRSFEKKLIDINPKWNVYSLFNTWWAIQYSESIWNKKNV